MLGVAGILEIEVHIIAGGLLMAVIWLVIGLVALLLGILDLMFSFVAIILIIAGSLSLIMAAYTVFVQRNRGMDRF